MGCSPWGHKESDWTEQLTLSLFLIITLASIYFYIMLSNSSESSQLGGVLDLKGIVSDVLVSIMMFTRRQWQPTPVLLPGKSHGWRSLVGCSPWDR